MYITILITNKN